MATTPTTPLLDDAVLARLAALAERADNSADWPAASWGLLRAAGALAWSLPRRYGGAELPPVALLAEHERLAGACLTTAFILSQREAAVRRLLASGGSPAAEALLPRLAGGEPFVTVGLSQLTTSRQHGAPALTAQPLHPSGAYHLEGEAPWVTGADQAGAIVLGATLPDGRQALFVLPADSPGVTVAAPLPLTALAGSRTSTLRCAGVRLGAEWLLAGPAERVLGAGGGGGLETSCLALGLAGAAGAWLRAEAGVRPDLLPVAMRFENAGVALRGRLHDLAQGAPDTARMLALRVACTRLALRATQTVLALSKGTGFVAPHPAQRWARQALFFLVWSCPRPAAEGILADLLPSGSEGE